MHLQLEYQYCDYCPSFSSIIRYKKNSYTVKKASSIKLKPKPITTEPDLEPEAVEDIPIYSQVDKKNKKEDTSVPLYDICSDSLYYNIDADTGASGSGFDHKIVPAHPVAVDHFAAHVRQCSSNNKLAFQDQFKVLYSQ